MEGPKCISSAVSSAPCTSSLPGAAGSCQSVQTFIEQGQTSIFLHFANDCHSATLILTVSVYTTSALSALSALSASN